MRERHPEDKLWSSQEHAEDENAQMHITAMCLGCEPVLADTALHTVRALGGGEAGTQCRPQDPTTSLSCHCTQPSTRPREWRGPCKR